MGAYSISRGSLPEKTVQAEGVREWLRPHPEYATIRLQPSGSNLNEGFVGPYGARDDSLGSIREASRRDFGALLEDVEVVQV
jgi:hypothetical protein